MKTENFKLKIGIDASRAFVKNRTGIEEYSYQIIKHLRQELKGQQVVLYTRPGGDEQVDFELPKEWQVKILPWKYIWTQVGLSLEMLFNPVDVLFVPAHTLPFIYPRKSFVTVHGLEYEFAPKSYSFYSRLFHRFFIKRSCLWAEKIIAVSKKTKDDLVDLYKVSQNKIIVIGNGFDKRINLRKIPPNPPLRKGGTDLRKILSNPLLRKGGTSLPEYFLFFIGRLEERKNIIGIIRAFEILKEKYNYQGKLLLGGGPGYGYEEIKKVIKKSPFKKDIKELGFIADKDKWIYLSRADLFLFPSFFEGFGIPILEAQSVGTPVITSSRQPMSEVVGDERILVDPENYQEIAETANKILVDEKLREDIINQGLENIKRFSWKESAEKIGEILKKK